MLKNIIKLQMFISKIKLEKLGNYRIWFRGKKKLYFLISIYKGLFWGKLLSVQKSNKEFKHTIRKENLCNL